MSTERWLPVAGFPRYEVSDHGQVRSLRYDPPRILSPSTDRDGYLRLTLWGGSGKKNWSVHALVCEAFVGPKPDGHVVRHLDGNPSNNVPGNLRWGTPSENSLDNVRLGTHHLAKRTHCKHGHPFDGTNSYVRTELSGKRSRRCRTCEQAYRDKRNARRRKLAPAGGRT